MADTATLAHSPSDATSKHVDLGDIRKDHWLRKQYRWQDVEHLIQSGQIISQVYDIETTDLNPTFSALTQFSGKLVDVQGRIIDEMKLDIRVPDDAIISPQAAIVTQSSPQALYSKDRVAPHIAMAKIMKYFRNPYRTLWDKLDSAEHKRLVYSTKDGEEVRAYVITSEAGDQQAEIRLHNSGRNLSYVYPDRVDYFCELLQQASDQPIILEALAGLFEVDVLSLLLPDADINPSQLKRQIRSYLEAHQNDYFAFLRQLEGSIEPALMEKMQRIPKEDRDPKHSKTYIDTQTQSRWVKVSAPTITSGHNVARFDDRVLWHYFHRYMSDDIFVTHIKEYQRARVDTLALAKLVALLDTKGGENRFRAGSKIDPRTGAAFESYSLSELMEANTREANEELGIDEGIRMPDGSKYDRTLAHANADYDVDATIALRAYLRRRMPELVRLVEENADMGRAEQFIMGGDGFETHPLRAFVRSSYPDGPRLQLGACVGIDKEINEKRQAVMIRTDVSQRLEDMTIPLKGGSKKLTEMSEGELAQLMKEQKSSPDALFELINLRKNPPVMPADMAYDRGVGGDIEQLEDNRRFLLEHPDFCHKVMEAYRKSYAAMADFRSVENPQAEDHLFTPLATPKQYVFNQDGQKVRLSETVHMEWTKALRLNRIIDSALRRAVKPRAIEYEVRLDTLEYFIDRIKAVDTTLCKKLGTKGINTPYPEAEMEELDEGYAAESCQFKILPPPERPFIPKKWDKKPSKDSSGVRHKVTQEELEWLNANAVEYLWKLRAELLDAFRDTTTHFTIQDQHGHDIAWETLNSMNHNDLTQRIQQGDYHVNMEACGIDGWNTNLLVRLFRDADRIDWVKNYWNQKGAADAVQHWEEWEEHLAAHDALRIHGAPHLGEDEQRWVTAQKVLKDAERMKHNVANNNRRAAQDEWGWWDIFMRDQPRSQQILDDCITHARLQLTQNPFTNTRKALMGYHSNAQGMPIDYAPFEIPENANIITIDVPDRMLESPLRHHDVAQNLFLLDVSAENRKKLHEADANSYLMLRGAQTGRTLFAPKPRLLSAEAISPTPYFSELYTRGEHLYEESGMQPPEREQFSPIATDALQPITHEVDVSMQTVPITKWDDFMALKSPELGNRAEILSGLVIDAKEISKPTTGEARLQGLVIGKDGKPGQHESGWEVNATITNVRTMTLKEVRERIKANDFTHEDAIRYGFVSLNDMRSKLTKLFTLQDRAADDEKNILYFIDIDPVEADMVWHQPNRRNLVRLVKDAAPKEPAPDPKEVYGGVDTKRTHIAPKRHVF